MPQGFPTHPARKAGALTYWTTRQEGAIDLESVCLADVALWDETSAGRSAW